MIRRFSEWSNDNMKMLEHYITKMKYDVKGTSVQRQPLANRARK